MIDVKGYYFFEVKYCYEDTYEEAEDRGVLYADNFNDALERIQRYFGNTIEDVHIWYVQMDTDEFLLERNFPGLMDILGSPIEDY